MRMELNIRSLSKAVVAVFLLCFSVSFSISTPAASGTVVQTEWVWTKQEISDQKTTRFPWLHKTAANITYSAFCFPGLLKAQEMEVETHLIELIAEYRGFQLILQKRLFWPHVPRTASIDSFSEPV